MDIRIRQSLKIPGEILLKLKTLGILVIYKGILYRGLIGTGLIGEHDILIPAQISRDHGRESHHRREGDMSVQIPLGVQLQKPFVQNTLSHIIPGFVITDIYDVPGGLIAVYAVGGDPLSLQQL